MSSEIAPLTSEVQAEMDAIIETFNNGFPKSVLSHNKYAPDEWACPGLQYLDGSVEGAMQCGLEAFPL